MGEINYSALLRGLVDRYFDNQMSRVEYLAQRRSLLEQIDRDFNGDVNAGGAMFRSPGQTASSSDPSESRGGFFRSPNAGSKPLAGLGESADHHCQSLTEPPRQ